jgi:hypothetical protein
MHITNKTILKMPFPINKIINGKDFVAQNAYYHLEKAI